MAAAPAAVPAAVGGSQGDGAAVIAAQEGEVVRLLQNNSPLGVAAILSGLVSSGFDVTETRVRLLLGFLMRGGRVKTVDPPPNPTFALN
jgi:hypothetical protein